MSVGLSRLLFLLVVSVCGVMSVKAQPPATPPLPYEDVGACPFEGCVYREWKARATVRVRAARRVDAPVVFRIRTGETVTAITGVVVTVRAGRVRFDTPQRLIALSGPIDVRPGQTLFLLTYQGEGFSKVWFNGKVYTDVDVSKILDGACVETPTRCPGRVIEPSRTEWWVQIRNKARQVGWTSEADKFDGKDALG